MIFADIIIFMVTKGPHLVCMFSVIRKVRTTQNCPSWEILSRCKGNNYAIIIINDFPCPFPLWHNNDIIYDIQFEYKIEILSYNSLF